MHSIWHATLSGKHSGIHYWFYLAQILPFSYSGILSGIHADILTYLLYTGTLLASYNLTLYLANALPLYLPCTGILLGICSGIQWHSGILFGMCSGMLPWQSIWHIFCITLAKLLSFYLAYILAFCLAYTDIYSGVAPGIYSGFYLALSPAISCIYSGILFGIVVGIVSVI